ncbi:MAG: right-handed parallel beta-helix repeat-containing protein, partial [Bacteroidota bacterium]|nr:right-handed parallel beta-helix repeat-containing protein [Bacteroidota bacterium]
EGSSINLYNSESYVEITGDLYIEDNATFTYTGDGYIKFSNPGGDATNNIFCGTNSSFVLQGSGQNDKIMEVQQSTVHFPGGINKVELRDGKIEMGSNCRLQNDIDTGDEETILNNIKITSDDGIYNGHRGFSFWGQQNITIEDCTFEYGKYGLNANNTYGGSALTVSGSDFIENQTGLYVYNKGVHLSYCEFTNNNTALNCEAMSFGSDLYVTNMFNNDYGAFYHGSSSADLNIDICEIQNNTYDGIRSSGNFDMELYCTYINNNRYGIYTTSGTDVHIENDARNYFSGNDKTIYLNYGKIFANHGYNCLKSVNNDYAIYGYTDIRAICGRPPNWDVNNNQWEDDISAPPVHGTNYSLGVWGCWFDYTPVTLIDNNPSVHFCPHIKGKGLNETASSDSLTQEETETSALPLVSVSEDQSLPLDEALYTL